jgi:hypothetical protein
MKTIELKVYSFAELSDKAKEKARDWWRQSSMDDDWWDCTFEDFAQICKILGIEIGERTQHCVLTGPKPREWDRTEKKIYFTGFSSQGDGACFEGRYSYAKGCAKAIRAYAPKDIQLHRIADALAEIQKVHHYRLAADIKHVGQYYHYNSVSVEVEEIDAQGNNQLDDKKAEEAIDTAMRDLCKWLYRTLEKEYEWRNADEQVDENIIAYEYDFTEDGKRTVAI